jgi:hypothetical protein
MKKSSFLLLLPVLLLTLALGCSEDADDPTPVVPVENQPMTCIECHSNRYVLEKVADPLPPPSEGEGGCGGTLPELAAWEHVFIGGNNGEQFLTSSHGRIPCVDCHGGVSPAVGKAQAHGDPDFVKYPSQEPETYCGPCHPTISANDKHSLHTQGFGQKYMVAKRGGFPSYEQFPDELHKGYDKNCGKCHASCGECHVQRPRQAGGGFIAAHKFQKTPDMRLNCTACHSARVAHAYFGEQFGYEKDVHYNNPGPHCIGCHSGSEMHGNGKVYTQRYAYPSMPQCEDCHSGVSKANTFHSLHWDAMSCQTCHSQDFQNCGSCHVNTGVRNGPYMGFKIGMNPMPEVKRFKYVVLRNAPAAADTWSAYGVPQLANFNSEPTFRMATPHNIQRWTNRTKVQPGESCTAACHIKDGKNKEFYLFEEDLQSWEVEANKPVVVNGKLPAGWN